MGERWILNASPIISLARAGYAELLEQLPERAAIPRAVADEIFAGPENDPAISFLSQADFEIVDVPSAPSDILAWDLGAGETAVISFALLHREWIAILDDAQARRCARSFELGIKGTLAIIINAKQRGIIGSAVTVLKQLRQAGFHLDDATIRSALAQTTQEDWTA